MHRLLAAGLLIFTLSATNAECGLFSRKKKSAPVRYGVSRDSQRKRTEKALDQQQKNRDKQVRIKEATQRKRAKEIEIRTKSSPANENN